ncbi:hypothetical protein GCM10023333_34540 [Ferrimonas pelagia]|uniref:Uncharacterized protein n=2 Tax=Ferrimonas pelagia TaxID=1177826 RepID=A0ABP9FKJ8_9GAMM
MKRSRHGEMNCLEQAVAIGTVEAEALSALERFVCPVWALEQDLDGATETESGVLLVNAQSWKDIA